MRDSKFITTIRFNKSLDFKNLRPYKIIRVINNIAYELDLPNNIKKRFRSFTLNYYTSIIVIFYRIKKKSNNYR